MSNNEDQNSTKVPFLGVVIHHLSELTDYRKPDKIAYNLSEILFLVYCSSVCGVETYEEISDFGHVRTNWLRKYYPYENGIPSHDTINRVMGMLRTSELEKMFTTLSSYGIELPEGDVVSVDGKWLRGSATATQKQTKRSDGGKQAAIMVNVYSTATRLCLATKEVNDKSGEKQAVEGILELLDLSNCIVTMDAGYCYKDVAKQVLEAGADYVIGLKGNQAKLYGFAQSAMESGRSDSEAITEEKAHSREEKRTCKVLSINSISDAMTNEEQEMLAAWDGLKCIIRIESEVRDMVKGTQRKDCRYFISSKIMDASKAMEVARSHWHIENKLHWCLDVVMGEDDSKKRANRSAQNFSFFRKVGFNKLQAGRDEKKTISLARMQKKCMLSEIFHQNILGLP